MSSPDTTGGAVVTPDVKMHGEWVDDDSTQQPTYEGGPADLSISRDRKPRGARRSFRPTTVLAVLLIIGGSLILLDLSGGPTETVRSFGHVVGGGAQEWADTAVGPLRRIPENRTAVEVLQEEVTALQARNNELEVEAALAEEGLHSTESSKKLRAWAKQAGLNVLPANVVAASSGVGASNTFTLDAGTADGVRSNSAVVANGGLAGRIVEAGPATSTLQLISDPESVVWARTQQLRNAVAVQGTGKGIELGLVDQFTELANGELITTLGSPDSRPYPRGVPIGRVGKASKSKDSLNRGIALEPIADLSSLDLVGIITPSGGQ